MQGYFQLQEANTLTCACVHEHTQTHSLSACFSSAVHADTDKMSFTTHIDIASNSITFHTNTKDIIIYSSPFPFSTLFSSIFNASSNSLQPGRRCATPRPSPPRPLLGSPCPLYVAYRTSWLPALASWSVLTGLNPPYPK